MLIKPLLLFSVFAILSASPALPKVMQMMLGNNGSITNQRFAVLTSYTATGTRNVRWETYPNNLVDDNGRFFNNLEHN